MIRPLEVKAVFWQHTLYLSYKVTDATHFASIRPRFSNLSNLETLGSRWPRVFGVYLYFRVLMLHICHESLVFTMMKGGLPFLSVKWRDRNDGIFCHNARSRSKRGEKNHLGTHELKGNRALDQTGPYRVASYKLILHERKVAESGWLRLWWLFQLQLKFLSV